MATIAQMELELLALQAGGIEIPGLDFDLIIAKLVKIKFPHIVSKEEIDAVIKSYTDTAKAMINEEINKIKSIVKQLNAGIETITKTVAMVISQIAAGVATSLAGIPNPGIALAAAMDAIQKKGLLQSMLDVLVNLCIQLLSSCIKIAFELPDAIFGLIAVVAGLNTLVKTIPG